MLLFKLLTIMEDHKSDSCLANNLTTVAFEKKTTADLNIALI